MKKLSKILLSVAAASAVAATMAISAMAEDTIIGEYNKETGVVTITSEVASTGASQTLLVLTDDDGTVLSSEIAQINQKDNGTSFSSFVLPAGLPESAEGKPGSVTYYIKIGGSLGTIQTGTLTIETAETPIETVTLVIGDTDSKLNGKVTAADATNAKKYVAKYKEGIGLVGTTRTKADGTTYVIGDTDSKLNGKVTAADATNIKKYVAKYKEGIGLVGTTIEVVAEN